MKKIEKLIYTNERGESIEFSHISVYHTNMNDVKGLNDMRNTIYTFNSMGQDGDTYIGSRIESRDIQITGNINERDKDKFISRRRWLNRVLNPQLAATLTYQYGDFIRIIDCRIDNAPIFISKTIFCEFTIRLTCLDPFWREKHESRADIARWIGCLEFELEIPDDEGIEMGARLPSLIVNVHNGGDVRTGLRIEFRATNILTNPMLLNVDTGEFLKFTNLILQSGEVLTVSTHYGRKRITITRDGTVTDGFKYLDYDSTYLQLETGDNLFRHDAETNADNLEVTLFHTNKYLGV